MVKLNIISNIPRTLAITAICIGESALEEGETDRK